jgi:hypothetical protein
MLHHITPLDTSSLFSSLRTLLILFFTLYSPTVLFTPSTSSILLVLLKFTMFCFDAIYPASPHSIHPLFYIYVRYSGGLLLTLIYSDQFSVVNCAFGQPYQRTCRIQIDSFALTYTFVVTSHGQSVRGMIIRRGSFVMDYRTIRVILDCHWDELGSE